MSARGAIFDMDGVLVDSGAPHRAPGRALPAQPGGRPGAGAAPPRRGGRGAEGGARALARRKRAHYVRLARAGVVAIPGAPAFVEALAARGIPRAVAPSPPRADPARRPA